MSATILVIEDDPASLELMAYLLRAHGLASITACTGDTGLDLVHRHRPVLVVCDIQLPGVDGYAIAQSIRSDESLRHIRLLAVTALAMVGDRERVLAAGFDAYLTKPIDPEKFVSHIQSLLGHSAGVMLRASQMTSTAPAPRPQSRGTLLVVDDSEVNQQLKRSIFEPHGYHVITASTLAAGLRLAYEQRPTAVITDVGLPDGNGLDLLRQLKTDPTVRGIPVVVITSTHAEVEVYRDSLALGAARFLIRPLDASQVLSEVESAIAQQR